MTNHGTWAPGPELLAAYFDGEFEGRDDLAPLRQRLESWLGSNPRARAELAEYRRLRHLWLETTPPEPDAAAWDNARVRLEACGTRPRSLAPGRGRANSWKITAFLTGAAAVLLTALFFTDHATAPEDDSPFPVASAQEVVILQVEGADTGTLVVGELPVQGPLDLVGPGDVTLTSVQPAKGDNMVPEVHIAGSGRPIIWARAESEED
jgi:anti-sigma factor RsiW